MAVNQTDVTTEDLKECLSDRTWRLNNLYRITDKAGREIPFVMNEVQQEFVDSLWYRNLVLKARQFGLTTAMMILMLDAAIFRPNTRCAVIAHTREDAARLFREKIAFAYDRLPVEIREQVTATSDRAGEMVFSNGSSITVGTSFRGGTLSYLHVSEFGKICAKWPDKAKEIVTGAFEAVGLECVITIESTAEGRSGYFYDYCQQAEKDWLRGLDLSPLDWEFFFFGWFRNPEYALSDEDTEKTEIPERLIKYALDLKTKHSISLTRNQLAWYLKKERTAGEDMKREYPSTPAEAFEQSVEGAYYSHQFKHIYANKQITKVPHDPALLVHTIWDLGYSDDTTIWFVQQSGREWHVIDYYEANGYGLEHYAQVLADKRKVNGYRYGAHVGPHDLDQHEFSTGKTRKQSAEEMGIYFKVAPRHEVMDGIEAVRRLLPLCWFDEGRCGPGIVHLECYRKDWDAKRGTWKPNPLHDEHSHAADSFRYFAVALAMLTGEYGRRQEAPERAPLSVVNGGVSGWYA